MNNDPISLQSNREGSCYGRPLLHRSLHPDLTHYQTTNFKLKEFADDNIKFDENGRKLSKREENTGKRRNRSLQAISPFPTVFSKGLFL